MSRKKKFIEKLTGEQKSSLEKGYKTGQHFLFRRKCQCILLSHERRTVEELSEFFGVSTTSIYKWLTLWETQGVEGLKLKPGRGRPLKLRLDDQKQTKRIKALVENEPRNLNRVVVQVKSELGISLSKKTLRRFLKNLNSDGSDFASV